MPTTVVKSIGTSSRDYTTLQAWEDACPSDLTAVDQIWKGECYNDSEFTAGVEINGQTTDATRYVWLTVAAGQSFIDHAGVRTNALMYDQSKGVGVKVGPGADTSAIIYGVAAYTLIERLQVKRTAGSTYYSGWTIATNFTANGSAVKDCICESNLATVRYTAAPRGNKFTNCLVVSTSGARGVAVDAGGALLNCTVVGTSGSADVGIVCNYFSGTIKNTAIFGFTTNVSTGYTAGMSYNGTDKSSIGGSNNQTSLTFSACFENTTNDFRLKAGSSLIGVGNTDATNAPNDITGTARDATTDGDIGAWEWSDPTLFGQLDETTASNTDYITTTTAGSIAELQLGSVTDPGVDTLHSIKLRASGSGSLQVDLVQGSGALMVSGGRQAKVRTRQPVAAASPSPNFRPRILATPSSQFESVGGRRREVSGGFSIGMGPEGVAAVCPATQIPGFVAYTVEAPVSITGDYSLLVYASASGNSSGLATHTIDHGTGLLSLTAFQFSDTSIVGFLDGNTTGSISGVFTRPTVAIAVRRGDTAWLYVGNQSSSSVTGTRAGELTGLVIGRDRVSNDPAGGVKTYLYALFDYGLSLMDVGRLLKAPWLVLAGEMVPGRIPAAKLIASRTIPLIATPTDYRRELLPAEAALITNYADLRVRFRGV